VEEAREQLPKLFFVPKVVKFKNASLAKIARLKPTGASDCFEITDKTEGIKAPREMPQIIMGEE
jgi:hypothetical protein